MTTFQVASFTHASGVEPVSAFAATINWGDGTTSAGTITLSGTTYSVIGSHTYSSGNNHKITTSVSEPGSSPVGGDKFGDERPGDDVVRLTSDLNDRGKQDDVHVQPVSAGFNASTGMDFILSVTPGAPAQNLANVAVGSKASNTDAGIIKQFFQPEVKSLVLSMSAHPQADSPADWFTESWLTDAWLTDFGL